MTVTSPMQPVDTSDRPFGLPPDIVLELPVPPSTNNLFFNIKKGRAKTKEYLNWQIMAGYHIQVARQKPLDGRVAVFLSVPENDRRDLDGYWKPVLDLLVTHQLIPDDRNKYVRELHAGWGEGENVRVEVRRLAA